MGTIVTTIALMICISMSRFVGVKCKKSTVILDKERERERERGRGREEEREGEKNKGETIYESSAKILTKYLLVRFVLLTYE